MDGLIMIFGILFVLIQGIVDLSSVYAQTLEQFVPQNPILCKPDPRYPGKNFFTITNDACRERGMDCELESTHCTFTVFPRLALTCLPVNFQCLMAFNQKKSGGIVTTPAPVPVTVRITTATPRRTTTGTNCLDSNRYCPAWSRVGYCQTNKYWMLPNCQKSCDSCGATLETINQPPTFGNCINHHKLCGFWAESGECQKNPTYMNDKCGASCNSCQQSGY